MKRAFIAFAITLTPVIAGACPVCFGAPGTPMANASDNAILFLLGVVGFVQIGFAALFWSFWRRARARRRLHDQFRIIEGGLH